jgi:hypothetical protein
LESNRDDIFEIAERLGLPVPAAYRDSVLANYERLLQLAALVMAAPLPDASQDHQADFVP